MNIAGVDGTKCGWLAVVQSKPVSVKCLATLEDVFTEFPSIEVVGMDMIIGLPDDANERDCDKQARRLLGQPRGSSVFRAPHRKLLRCSSYDEANGLSKSLTGKGTTKQTFSLMPNINELDQVVRKHGQERIREVHPEVSFMAMNSGSAMQHNKDTPEGREERRNLLVQHFGEGFVGEAESKTRLIVDLYDAMAALWSAQRLAEGKATPIPQTPTLDSTGLRMEISY